LLHSWLLPIGLQLESQRGAWWFNPADLIWRLECVWNPTNIPLAREFYKAIPVVS